MCFSEFKTVCFLGGTPEYAELLVCGQRADTCTPKSHDGWTPPRARDAGSDEQVVAGAMRCVTPRH